MSSETITVYIDPAQLAAQKKNNYSLYLAKKVNGVFTVIWQSKGPVATVNTPSYEYSNTFNIAVPSYKVNYGNVTQVDGSVSFTSAGKPVDIDLGQVVTLDADGLFGVPQNGGTDGVLTVNNQLQGNPHEALGDSDGNPIFVNVASGMDIGVAELTPVDEYQLWFDNYQATGTIIAHNVSNPGIVTFDGGTDNKTISYNANGEWQNGPLPPSQLAIDPSAKATSVAVIVAATFTTALTTAAVTYIMNTLISKFSPNLRPESISATIGHMTVTMKFERQAGPTLADLQLDRYEQAVNNALTAAAADKNSGIAAHSWRLSEPQLEARF